VVLEEDSDCAQDESSPRGMATKGRFLSIPEAESSLYHLDPARNPSLVAIPRATEAVPMARATHSHSANDATPADS